MAREDKRRKGATPDLGEWLINLTISNKTWKNVANVFLDELFDRSVRWILQDEPSWESLER
jgi:hypothetical protein